ncbi:GNAT family N-acetyltransferase [Streptomyces sp. NPDC057638]|uniref:GNAT family N-acetyltransferase n=1 Tax=Streptomyces sp. NPDC057638 TaxID=3346190 RepID=UPI00369106DB
MPIPPAELPIRRLTISDLIACADLAESWEWPREEHRWGLLLTAGRAYGIDDPSGKGLIAASVLNSYGSYGPESYGASTPELSTIGMVLVAERHARQGIGRRMMRHVMAEAADGPLTLYATDAGQALYEGLGFTTVASVEMFRGRLRPTGPTAVTTRPATAEDLAAIVRLDTEVFGPDRTHLLARLPAFADQLQVAEENGVLTGYAAAWPTPEVQAIGPLVAQDTTTAQALIAALARGTDQSLRTTIDARHSSLIDWLGEHGLERTGSRTVMVHALDDLPGDWTRRFAPLSLAHG